jgi:hypothetical protein
MDKLLLEITATIVNMIIHAPLGKSKKRKPNAKQRELQSSWEQLLKKYEPKKPVPKRKDDGFKYSLGRPACRETPKFPSLNNGVDCAAATKKQSPIYTGTKMKGIGTMHKSNAVPIFSDDEAKDIATMRRG